MKGIADMKFEDLTGQVFGRLTVLKRVENKGKHTCFLCQCSCGNQVVVKAQQLKNSKCKSCGCLKKEVGKKLDLTGKKFNRLLVLSLAYVKNRQTYWNCLCDCGEYTIKRGTCIVSGHVTSCGCRKKETEQENCFKPTHGKKGTRVYHMAGYEKQMFKFKLSTV